MIQGTMSGVGKSILTAGILRVLKNEGFKVAPFKSQNMALNSYVTPDGKEIGRAQALQAMAAGRLPSSDMNPILLKPTGDTTSQVIIDGLPVGNMKASDYFRNKKKYIPVVKEAFERLSEDNDIVVIEGAGSPVEINLRDNDIVNMGLAEILDAPVILVGNIDPGGVFAQLLGTVQLLSEKERERVKALVINKFRGDVSLLTPGLEMFKGYCSIPFAGVVPFTDLKLDEEDSLSDRLTLKDGFAQGKRAVRIAVIRLPFISNYTDFAVFEDVPGIEMIYTNSPQAVTDADIVILPGTKNTISDYKWLVDTGLDAAVKRAADKGQIIMGICGGFQMLGNTISDSDNLEGGGTVTALGLLPVDTAFAGEKTLRQTEGTVSGIEGIFEELNGSFYKGYEIHMGKSVLGTGKENEAFITEGNVIGTYIHGIFDSGEVAKRLVEIAAKKGRSISEIQTQDHSILELPPKDRGLLELSGEFSSYYKRQNEELDRLADVLKKSLDFDMIHRIIGV